MDNSLEMIPEIQSTAESTTIVVKYVNFVFFLLNSKKYLKRRENVPNIEKKGNDVLVLKAENNDRKGHS